MKKLLFISILFFATHGVLAQDTIQVEYNKFSDAEIALLNKIADDNIRMQLENYPELLELVMEKDLTDFDLDNKIQVLIDRYNNEMEFVAIANDSVLKALRDRLIKTYKPDNYHIDSIRKSDNFHTLDIFNPINYTTIWHRMPAANGKVSSEELLNRASTHYIKREGVLHIEFDPIYIETLTNAGMLNVRINAFIERKDGTVKPLNVLGLTQVFNEVTSQNKALTNPKNLSEAIKVEDKYQVIYLNSTSNTLSAEVEVSFEKISEGDVLILQITNTEVGNVGFTSKFKFADYGWTNGPTSGLSFVRTMSNDQDFQAAGTAGYFFKFEPKPSASFIIKFLSPSFGPEINVFQQDDETLIGVGMFLSTIGNTVKFGVGRYLNENTLPNNYYFSIGLNFVEGIQTISGLLQKTKE